MLKSEIGIFRILALLEGTSLLILLFIAMPLKYIWERPQAVEIIGMAHGVLFIAFIIMALYLTIDRKWKLISRSIPIMISSFIPFGTFYIDHRILKNLE